MSDPTMAEKNRFSRKAAVYILPLEFSPLFKVFYLAPCGRHKLWEDTVAYTYSHGALAEDKTISHKESPQKYSTQADFCLSNSSLLLASVCVYEILTKVCGEKQKKMGQKMGGCVNLLPSTVHWYTEDPFLDKSSVITQNMEVH